MITQLQLKKLHFPNFAAQTNIQSNFRFKKQNSAFFHFSFIGSNACCS